MPFRQQELPDNESGAESFESGAESFIQRTDRWTDGRGVPMIDVPRCQNALFSPRFSFQLVFVGPRRF